MELETQWAVTQFSTFCQCDLSGIFLCQLSGRGCDHPSRIPRRSISRSFRPSDRVRASLERKRQRRVHHFLAEWIEVHQRGESLFSSRYYLHDNDDPFFEQGPYVRLDGRFSLDSADGHWGIDLIGKNLTDRIVIAGVGGLYNLSKEEPLNVALNFAITGSLRQV